MRRYRIGILAAALVLAGMLPARVHAEEAGRIQMDEKGTVTLVSSQMAKDEVSTMSFSISVDAAKGESAEFLFEESTAKILEYRYNREEKKMDVYLAGTQTLFPAGSDSLTIGRIVVRDGNGSGISATASVSADSLQYVYGTELKTLEGMESTGAVQISGGGTPPQPTVTPTPRPTQAPTPTPRPTTAPQNPSDTGNDDWEDDNHSQGTDSSTITGNPQKTAAPQKTPKPAATKVPVVQVPQSTQKPSPSPSPEGPAQTMEPEESETDQSAGAMPEQSSESDDDQQGEEETGGKIDWIWVLAVGGIVIFAGVAVMAFVTLSRKPDQ